MLYLRIPLICALAAFLSAGAAREADAKPEYARKEGVACQHCHLTGSPGALDQLTGRRQTTERNARGIYYGAHNHTFQGYIERPVTTSAGGPTFRFAWKEEFKSLPRRMAVADVTEVHFVNLKRLLTLSYLAMLSALAIAFSILISQLPFRDPQ